MRIIPQTEHFCDICDVRGCPSGTGPMEPGCAMSGEIREYARKFGGLESDAEAGDDARYINTPGRKQVQAP